MKMYGVRWQRPTQKGHIAHDLASSLFDDEYNDALVTQLDLPLAYQACASSNNDGWNF